MAEQPALHLALYTPTDEGHSETTVREIVAAQRVLLSEGSSGHWPPFRFYTPNRDSKLSGRVSGCIDGYCTVETTRLDTRGISGTPDDSLRSTGYLQRRRRRCPHGGSVELAD